jgi:hypothetical protein
VQCAEHLVACFWAAVLTAIYLKWRVFLSRNIAAAGVPSTAAATRSLRAGVSGWRRSCVGSMAPSAWSPCRRRVVSQNGYLLSRRVRSFPANASGFDTHRDSISSRFAGRGGAESAEDEATSLVPAEEPTGGMVAAAPGALAAQALLSEARAHAAELAKSVHKRVVREREAGARSMPTKGARTWGSKAIYAREVGGINMMP